MFWQITAFPSCEYHVFLSHCREDHDQLVRPVYDALVAAGIRPWLDREDYYYGRDSRTALRDAVLLSRHVLFFVTDAMLSTGRGWCVFELAFAEMIQANFQEQGGTLANTFLPLFFVGPGDERLPRTVWQAVRDRGRFRPDATNPVAWAVEEALSFLRREQQLAGRWADVIGKDRTLRQRLRTSARYDRVTRFDPAPLPPPG